VEPRLVLEQSQKLIITPELKQAITVLCLPALELTNYIQQQIEDNPVLELPEGLADEPGFQVNEDGGIDLKVLFADCSDLGMGPAVSRTSKEDRVFEPVAVQYSTLQEYLKFQLHIIKLPQRQIKIGDFIIDNINNEGYLSIKATEISAILGVSHEEVRDLLTIIRTFDPTGVGAESLAECLKLQIEPSDSRYEILVELVDKHLDDVAANRLVTIAKNLRLSLQEIQELVDIIKSLDPKPGLQYCEEKTIEYIMPDVMIERVDDDYVVLVNDTTVPRLNINSYYRNMVSMEKTVDDKVRKFIEGKLNSAVWLIKSIEQRRITLYKVASTVVEYQRDFLDKGIEYLVPLTLREVADKIGVHESTVSRAISNKFVQTPRGTFSWKFFFASGVYTNRGEAASTNWVKKVIQDLISTEDLRQPLSDQKITDILRTKGINISRRTVAKYREELGILSSSRRKRY
jgi:RNA polymerase sigma-54 factor